MEQLWERNREGRKETNRKPSTRTGKEGMGNQAGKNGESQEAKAERRHRGSHCEAEAGRKRKGRNRGQVARTGRDVDERKQIGREKTESESTR